MIEGHKGSLICAPCLTIAFRALEVDEAGEAPGGWTCAMCLEERDQLGWRSPIREEAIICLRCVKQSATRFEKDPEIEWTRPGG